MPKNSPQTQAKAEDPFSGHLQRQLLGAELRPEHQTNYSRLLTTLLHGAPFQCILCEIRDEPLRDRLIDTINEAAATQQLKSTCLDAGEFRPDADPGELEIRLQALAQEYALIHLRGFDRWLTREHWQALNIRRDAIAASCRARLLWWLTPDSVRQCALEAPDLWAWRSGVYEFSPVAPLTLPNRAYFSPAFDNRSIPERTRRISQIRAWLQQNPPDELRLPLLDELAGLLTTFGLFDEALRIRLDEEVPDYERLGDVRSRAVVLGKIADIHQARGQLDEALRIRLEEEMPVYEKLDDVRERAIALGKVADIYQVRGQLAEAQGIYLKEQLPIFEILGDVRSRAVTLGKIADIHQARGQLDEALRIRLDEEIPVYKKLGDVCSRAITLGKIADIHQARGQLAEALRIRLDEQLPIFEKLGDVRSRAVTLGQIADIHQARGQLDEALRIYLNEEMPVYEKLGDMRERLICQTQIATTLLHRNQKDDRKKARALLQAALATAKKIGLPMEVQKIKSLLQNMRRPTQQV